MSPEKRIEYARRTGWALFYFSILNMYISYLSHQDDGMEGATFLNLNILEPTPETYNTIAIVASTLAALIAFRYASRVKQSLTNS